VEAAGPCDLSLRVQAGGPLLGPLDWPLREWDALRAGEHAVWRLGPGRHLLGLTRMHLYDARFDVSGAAARIAARPGRVVKGFLQPFPPA
jgi:hypothetical protein